MRLVLLLLLAAGPAAAWEFFPVPVCTLRHDTPDGGSVTVTHDGRRDEPYAIALARPDGWPDAAVFAIRFDGPRGLTISTRRHRVEGGTLTVTDRGFGNVLDGLEFNATATAVAGGDTAVYDLTGAAPQVRRFRACAEGGIA